MKNIKILYAITALLVVFLGACQKDEVIGGTAVEKLSGEWWVQLDGTGGYAHISTYNTAANSPTEMWFDDGFWQAKYKVTVDPVTLKFSATEVANSDDSYPITITINGEVIPRGAKGPSSKAVTDSIYFEAKYSDDPDTYIVSGYKRTGFTSDDH